MLRCMKYIVALRRKIENSANASDSSIFLLGSLHFNASPHMFEKSAYSLLLGRTSSVSRWSNPTTIVIAELLKTNVITSENFFEIFTNLAICWKPRVSDGTFFSKKRVTIHRCGQSAGKVKRTVKRINTSALTKSRYSA